MTKAPLVSLSRDANEETDEADLYETNARFLRPAVWFVDQSGTDL